MFPTQDTSHPGNSKGDAGEKSRHKNNSKGGIRNLEEKNLGTKGKKSLTSVKELPE